MLQIGEFSKICQVSVKTLRHYDKLGLLIPAKIDHLTGYRYYQIEQIDTMNYIQRLKRYGFSLDEIIHIIALSDQREISQLLRNSRKSCEWSSEIWPSFLKNYKRIFQYLKGLVTL